MATAPVPARLPRCFVWLPLVVGALLLAALYCVFYVAPPEVTMGEVQRVFYFHVASAFAGLLLFITCSLASVAFLVTRGRPGLGALARLNDRLAASAGEIGVLFGVIVLVTGPIWAKPVWGAYWTWEPRLMLMLLTVFLFVGYLVLRAYAGGDDRGKRLSAGVAVVGGPAVYLVHVAVAKWGGNHPQVLTGQGGGLAPGPMQWTFAISVAATLVFAAYLVYTRFQHHRLVEDLEDAFLELDDADLNQTRRRAPRPRVRPPAPPTAPSPLGAPEDQA